MKATVQALTPSLASERSWAAVLADLVKARLTSLVLLTTLVGFYLGSRSPVSFGLLFHTLVATALLAGGAAALNQLLERRQDAQMQRTKSRPLPSGRMQPETVLLIGVVASACGLVQLAVAVNTLTTVLGAVTLVSYVFLYTPLKRVTWLNTHVGAIPGALPPLMGWTAAHGELSVEGWVLFALLALWQLPHFFAIAWLYREDYARAGFKMLPLGDPHGRRTARQSVICTGLLLAASAGPFVLELAGVVYLVGALALGGAYLGCAADFARRRTDTAARRLFFFSILYLPLLLVLLTVDKLK